MLMDHPSQVTTSCGEDRSQSRFKYLPPTQVAVVMKELEASNTEVKKALTDTLEAVQEVAHSWGARLYLDVEGYRLFA